MLALLDDSGKILSYSYTFSEPDTKYYNGLKKDKAHKKVGTEKILIRTVEVEPGYYAWVHAVKTFSGTTRPVENSTAYVFYVN